MPNNNAIFWRNLCKILRLCQNIVLSIMALVLQAADRKQGVISDCLCTQGVLAPRCYASVSYVAERPWAICFCPFFIYFRNLNSLICSLDP